MTDVEVFDSSLPSFGDAFDSWGKADRLLFGFAEHHMTSTYLGTSTGLRRRFDQPDGRVEINGKSADSRAERLRRPTHERLRRRRRDRTRPTGCMQRLDWAAHRIDLPAGRYETIMPPGPPSATDALRVLVGASARDAAEGRSVFSAANGATRVGEKLSPLPLRLYSDPSAPGSGVRAVLDRRVVRVGVSTRSSTTASRTGPTDWVTDGKLTNLIANRWAGGQRARAAPAGREPDPRRRRHRVAGGDDRLAPNAACC